MIKLPKPFRKQGQQLCNDGNTTVFFDAYNKAQLKRAVRDVLEEAAKHLEDNYGLPGSAELVRALIKEIPE